MTNLKRTVSHLLTDVRTVQSRAETALRFHWVVCDGNPTVNHPELGELPHPEADEIKAALEEVVRILEPYRRER